MEMVKKNLFSISCGVVALLALIAWFWPVGSMYSSFQDDLKKRVEVDGKAKSMKSKPRTVPPVGADGTPQPLTHFPNAETIKAVKDATDALTQNADQTLAFVVDMNHAGHDLLEPGSLPAPIDNNQNFHFRSQYIAMMDYGGKPDPLDRRNPDAGPFNLLDQVLNATKLATAGEIKDAQDKKWAADYQPRVYTVNGQEINRPDIEAQFAKDTATFVKDFHQARASQFRIYCEPDALTRAPHLTPTDTPSATDIWFAQMTLWVEQDVCEAIRVMNKNVKLEPGQGIQMSPVKNLIEVTISPDVRMYVMGQSVSLTPGGAQPELDPSQKMFSISPTGRVCNTLYDVVKFRVTAVVLPGHLQEFLERLRYRRLLTVTQMSVQDVDWKAAEDLGYIYGPARCVEVTLDCEELFMRDWTVRQLAPDPNHLPPMPVDVQKMLGITPQAPAAGPAPGKVAMQ
jgi:hypothetical protein